MKQHAEFERRTQQTFRKEEMERKEISYQFQWNSRCLPRQFTVNESQDL